MPSLLVRSLNGKNPVLQPDDDIRLPESKANLLDMAERSRHLQERSAVARSLPIVFFERYIPEPDIETALHGLQCAR